MSPYLEMCVAQCWLAAAVAVVYGWHGEAAAIVVLGALLAG